VTDGLRIATKADTGRLCSMPFPHGLRASELIDLQWTQVDFEAATLAVTRVKHGTPATHPLTGRELRALRRLHCEGEGRSPFLFVSERGAPMAVSSFPS
jgi:type 1 fimbriae regulatory protein FimB/type 1 fimbriae regulatory protein FimE